jgi:putative tricarboxylic transport membrane protein
MAMTMKRTVLIEGILLLVFSFVGLGEAIHLISDIDPHTVYDALGPGWYIFFLSLALMTTGAIHLIVHYRKGVAVAKEVVDKALRLRMIGMVLAMALYILLIDFIGYFVATPLFFLMEFRLAGITSWRRNIILTVIVSAAYYFVFVEYCSMVFPRGIFY